MPDFLLIFLAGLGELVHLVLLFLASGLGVFGSGEEGGNVVMEEKIAADGGKGRLIRFVLCFLYCYYYFLSELRGTFLNPAGEVIQTPRRG